MEKRLFKVIDKLEKMQEKIQQEPSTHSLLFLKPPTATDEKIQGIVRTWLKAHGFSVESTAQIPNTLKVWRALYPDFDTKLLRGLYELSQGKIGPYNRILSAIKPGFGDPNYFVLWLLHGPEDAASKLKALQGSAADLCGFFLDPLFDLEKADSLRRVLTMVFLRRGILPRSVDYEEFWLIDGLVHVPDPDDGINTLERLKR